LAKENDRIEVTDGQIGRILAHCPNDPEDKIWPLKPVRDLIEELANSKIEQNMAIEKINMRGATSRAMFDGGKQEHALAEQYKRWSLALSTHWPRVAAMLNAISKDWEHWAKIEDEEAERDRIKFR
jgi:hypothetical protein